MDILHTVLKKINLGGSIQGTYICLDVLTQRLCCPRLYFLLSPCRLVFLKWPCFGWIPWHFICLTHSFIYKKIRPKDSRLAQSYMRENTCTSQLLHTNVLTHTKRKMLTDQYRVSSDPCLVMTLWPAVQTHTHTRAHTYTLERLNWCQPAKCC